MYSPGPAHFAVAATCVDETRVMRFSRRLNAPAATAKDQALE